MTLDAAGRQLLASLLERCRAEIIERATDWVVAEAVDLRSQRPREETRRLVEEVVSGNEAALLSGDLGPLHAFVDFVTSYRAASEFRVSTPLRGMLCFRRALEEILQREASDPRRALDILIAADDIYFEIVFRTADLYEDKLTSALQQRRRELEAELSTLSSPVIEVWDGVLVLPIIGEIGAARAEEVLYRVLSAIRAHRARIVLVDLTGLSLVNEEAMLHLARLTRVARLLGAEVMLVGLSARAAITLSAIDVSLGKIRSFATLHDGLKVALAAMELDVVKRARRASAEDERPEDDQDQHRDHGGEPDDHKHDPAL